MLREDKKPFCVMHCSHKALDFGFVEKLKIQYGYTQKAMGFKNSKSAKPSFIVKSKFVK
jgi:Fe-S-cluster-containing dehydrogenase component